MKLPAKARSNPSPPWEFLIGLAVALAAAYFLAPSAWEPGGETLKNWASARITRETGSFPRSNYGWLYNAYLQLFLGLPYPLSLQLEHLVTQLFAYGALIALLRRFLTRAAAVLLLCAFIPNLWIIESSARVAGLSCLALYLAAGESSPWVRGWLPVPLLAASLFDSLYIPFLGGHILGLAVMRRLRGEAFVQKPDWKARGGRGPWLAKAALAAVALVSASFPSHRADNTVFSFEYPWVPVKNGQILTISSMEAADWEYAKDNYPQSQWMYKDWYVVHHEAFGSAQTLLEAVRYNPKFYVKKVADEFQSVVWASTGFLIGFRDVPSPVRRALLPILWSLLLMSAYWTLRFFLMHGEQHKIFSLGAGLAATALALSMAIVSTRYMMALLPVGLLAICHLGQSLRASALLIRRPVDGIDGATGWGRAAVLAAGALLLLTALAANELVLRAFMPPGAVIAVSRRVLFAALDVLLIIGGAAMLLKPGFFIGLARGLEEIPYPAAASNLTLIAAAVAGVLVFTAAAPSYRTEGGDYLLRNPYALHGKLWSARGPLLASLGRGKRVLAPEYNWIRSVGDVDLDKVYHPLYLPPFADASGKTERFLEGLDVIWVSDDWATPAFDLATQVHLRYFLHVEPFLRRALKEGWTVEQVPGYGRIYRRPAMRSFIEHKR